MAALEKFVSVARAKGIVVVGVQMPMYAGSVQLLENDPQRGFIDLLRDFRAHVQNGYFAGLGLPFFDFLKLPRYAGDYRYFCDAVHPLEPVCLPVLLTMASDPRVQRVLPKLDIASLRQSQEDDEHAPRHVYLDPNDY